MLEPGPETDLKVAEACGIPATIYFDHDLQENIVTPLVAGEYPPHFRPSTDLNDAFLAAEKAGLFSDEIPNGKCGVLMLDSHASIWEVRVYTHGFDGDPLSEEPTPALAICAAILNIKEKA